MKLLFKQRFFSWFDSYDIYDESGETVFVVKGQLSWGHKLMIYDAFGNSLGMVKEEILTLLPRFALFIGESYIGEIRKEFTLFRQAYTLNCNGWSVNGNWIGWDYQVTNASGNYVAQISKEIFNFTDTYIIDIYNPNDALTCLMIVLAIDAANCRNN